MSKHTHMWIPIAIDKEIGVIVFECTDCNTYCWDEMALIEYRKNFDK